MEISVRVQIDQCPWCSGSHVTPFFRLDQLVIDGSVYRGYGLCEMTGQFLFVDRLQVPTTEERERVEGSNA